jgi:2-methylcitrate dehydratase PrpD
MYTNDLAQYITSTAYHQLPDKVVEKAKLCFLDFLAISLRGSQTQSAQSVRAIIGDGDDSTVIGGSQTTALDASLANGVSAHSLDLDDGHRLAHLHPGACVIPAALSLSEAYDKSGKDLINSIVVGYQVAIRLGMLINPEHRHRGFHSTGTCGTFGAAAAACKIMDLHDEAVLNALGLAGTQAAGLMASDHSGSMAKHLHSGKAAQTGVLSALLAKNGFTGAHTIIEGKEGFISTMADPKLTHNQYHHIYPSSEEYEILRVYFKNYPVCRHLHSTLDAVLYLMIENNLKSTEISGVTIETYKIAAEHNDYHPKTREAMKQSLPVSTAIAIVKGGLDLKDFNMDQSIAEITQKISIECEEELNRLYPLKRPSKVTIKTKNQSYTERINLPWGEPEKPYNKDDLISKFSNLNPHVDLSILDHLNHLDSQQIRDLMEVIRANFSGK